jgi:hypothetical protein
MVPAAVDCKEGGQGDEETLSLAGEVRGSRPLGSEGGSRPLGSEGGSRPLGSEGGIANWKGRFSL